MENLLTELFYLKYGAYFSVSIREKKTHGADLRNSLSRIYDIIVENRILQNRQESCDIG